MTEKLKSLFYEYGVLAIIIHFTLFFGCWIYFYIALNNGLNLDDLDWLPDFVKQGGHIAIAYGITQALKIVRIPLTIALTPLVGRFVLKRKKLVSNTDQNAAVDDAAPDKS